MSSEPTVNREIVRAVQINPSWDVQTSLAYVLEAIDGLDRRFSAVLSERDRRYVETDRRYEERHQSTQLALSAALVSQEKAVGAALAAAKEAVAKAEASSERRFEGVNEFRGLVEDQQRLFMPRAEAERVAIAQDEKIKELTDRLNRAEGRSAGGGAAWGSVAVGVGILLTVIGLVLTAIAMFGRGTP